MPYFYEDDYEPQRCPRPSPDFSCDLSSPVAIYNWLNDRVYKQDDWKRAASLILYNHINHRTSINICCGPPGCGKTLVMETLELIYPNIHIKDGSTISREGWNGSSKIGSIVSECGEGSIIVLDEFDKLVAPEYSSRGVNVAGKIQAELLKQFDGIEVSLKEGGNSTTTDTHGISWVLLGSFNQKAEEIREHKSPCKIGFGATKDDYQVYQENLTMQDLIDFGLLPEIASRVNRLCCVEPLTQSDYLFLLTKHPASPLLELEKKYGIRLKLSRKQLKQIAEDAYESGLGLRYCKHEILKHIDKQVFNSFEKVEKVPIAS